MSSPETLKETIFDRIDECRGQLQEGKTDLTGIEDGVRAYCEAVAALPSGQMHLHERDLKALMRAMEALNNELVAAQMAVHDELDALDRLRQASAAYKRSDAISHTHIKGKKGAPS